MAPLAPTMGTGELGLESSWAKQAAAPVMQVEDQKFDASQGIFHVISENIQGPHVADEVKPAAVEKHGTEDGDDAAHDIAVSQVEEKIPGHKAKDPDEFLQFSSHGHFEKKYQHIEGNDGVAYYGDPARRYVVS